jgi:hypothetical protein
MISCRTFISYSLTAVLLTAAAGQSTAQERVLSDQILPGETFLYFSMPSVQRFKGAFQNSPTGHLLADPAMDDIKEELHNAFSGQLHEGFAQVQDAIGLSVEELLDIPTGEVTFAICSAGARANTMGAVLILDYGDHQSDVQRLLDQAVAALGNAPNLESADAEYDGTELTMFNIDADIAKQTPLAKEFGWFQKDERLVVSNSRDVLEMIIDSWAGDSDDTLQQNDVYSYIMQKCQTSERSSLMTTYFDPIGLFTKVIHTGSAGEAGMGAGFALGMLPTFGVDQLKAMGSAVQMDVDSFDAVSRTFIYCEQPPRGAMQIFQLDQVETSPPKWVKEGASLYLSAKWKIDQAYTAVETLFDMFQGNGAFSRIVDQAAETGPQVHIKQDFIDQLDGSLQMVSAPGQSGEGYSGDEMLFAMGVRDESRISDLLVKFTSMPGAPFDSREFQGVTVYEIENPGTGQTVSVTVANGQLLIGIGETLFAQALRNDNDIRPLADSDDYRRIAEHIPSGSLAVTYTNPASQYRSMYEMLRSGEAVDSFPGLDDVLTQIDFGRLPPFEVIEKYMAPAGGFWIGDENGVLMEQFSLKPNN